MNVISFMDAKKNGTMLPSIMMSKNSSNTNKSIGQLLSEAFKALDKRK